jgi:hypothetical protein
MCCRTSVPGARRSCIRDRSRRAGHDHRPAWCMSTLAWCARNDNSTDWSPEVSRDPRCGDPPGLLSARRPACPVAVGLCKTWAVGTPVSTPGETFMISPHLNGTFVRGSNDCPSADAGTVSPITSTAVLEARESALSCTNTDTARTVRRRDARRRGRLEVSWPAGDFGRRRVPVTSM